MHIHAQSSRVNAVSISRDASGNLKLGKEAAIKFWPLLNTEDREFLKQKYSLTLEINNG